MDSVAGKPARERAQLFEFSAERHAPRIDAVIIEKDFWVCWALHRLFDVIEFRPQLIFKGGTSLSKVFKAIERFSEDVDLSLSRRDLGYADGRDPEGAGISKRESERRIEALLAACVQTVREKLLPELRQDFATVLGGSGWSVDVDTNDPQTLVFAYPPSGLVESPYVRPSIRLEMGARSDDWPSVDAEVKPYAAEDFPAMFSQPACRARTLAAERTFWEKATLLHAEYHRPPEKLSNERISRHYYDLYCLSCNEIAKRALDRDDLLKRVVQHKRCFFPRAWANYETATPGTFHLAPPEARMEMHRKDYNAMKAMIFGDAPKWDEIMAAIRDLEDRINRR